MKRWFLALAVALALAATGCAQDPSGDVRQGPGGPDAVPIAMEDDDFVPDVLELDAGSEVTLEVTNRGGSGHDFTIDDLDVSTGTVVPGGIMTATFTVPAGTTGYRCTFHPGMDGRIIAT